MYNHLIKMKENERIIYGVKKTGDFITSLAPNFKAIDLVRGDSIVVDKWVETTTKELYYSICKEKYSAGDLTEHLYDLYKMATNYDKAYLVK